MAQGNYESGFNIGAKSSNVNMDPLQKGLTGLSDELKKQQEIGRKRQEAFDESRNKFRAQQQEAFGEFVYEDQFTDTGLKDFDAAGEKLRKSVKNTFESNMFAYNSGAIDENELRRRNSITKGHVKEMSGVYDKAKVALDQYNKLEAEGKGSAANDIKRDSLQDFFDKFRVQEGEVGLEMSTISESNGQKTIDTVTPDQFNELFNFGQGVDLSADLKEIMDEIGSDTYIQGNTKFQDWLKGKDKLDATSRLRFDAIVEGYSDDQIIDAAKKLKTVSFSEVKPSTLRDKSILAKLKKEVSQGMVDYAKEQLRLKKASVPYIAPLVKDPQKTATERKESANSDAVYSNVRSLFSNDPEIVSTALENLKNSDKNISSILRSGADKIVVQYSDDKRDDTVISLSLGENGFNVDDSALNITAELLSSSIKNSLDASEKAQSRYYKKNNITDKTYVGDFQDFGTPALKYNAVELKSASGYTVAQSLDENSTKRYKDAAITFLAKNGINTSRILIEEIGGWGKDTAIVLTALNQSGQAAGKFVISEKLSLPEKIKVLEDMAISMKKEGVVKDSNTKKGPLD